MTKCQSSLLTALSLASLLSIKGLAQNAQGTAQNKVSERSPVKVEQLQKVELNTDLGVLFDRIQLAGLDTHRTAAAKCSTQTCGDNSTCCPGLVCVYPKNATVGACRKQ